MVDQKRYERPARFYSARFQQGVVNTNVLATVFVSVVLCSAVSAGVSPQADATETPVHRSSPDGDFGGDVSAFMQRSIVTMNASVDSGMWKEAFETAENQTRKQALVTQRTAVLMARFDALKTRIKRFTPDPTNRSVAHRARRARLVADRNTLQTSVAEAKTTAASEGVNATRLSGLNRRIVNLTLGDADNRNRSTANATPDEPTTSTAGDRHPTGMTYGGP